MRRGSEGVAGPADVVTPAAEDDPQAVTPRRMKKAGREVVRLMLDSPDPNRKAVAEQVLKPAVDAMPDE